MPPTSRQARKAQMRSQQDYDHSIPTDGRATRSSSWDTRSCSRMTTTCATARSRRRGTRSTAGSSSRSSRSSGPWTNQVTGHGPSSIGRHAFRPRLRLKDTVGRRLPGSGGRSRATARDGGHDRRVSPVAGGRCRRAAVRRRVHAHGAARLRSRSRVACVCSAPDPDLALCSGFATEFSSSALGGPDEASSCAGSLMRNLTAIAGSPVARQS